MFLPYRSKNPPESLPIATCLLITANVVVYALTSNGLDAYPDVIRQWGLKSSNLDVPHLFSAMFLHANLMHLLGNMWFLYLIGFAVEGRLRSLKYLVVYLGGGICGALLHHFILGRLYPDVPGIGASGAIMAVLGAALYMFPYGKMRTFYWFFFRWIGAFDCPMWGVGLYFLGFDLLLAILTGTGSGGGVGHLVHLGGAAGGFLLAAAFRPRRDSAEASDAKAIVAEVKDLSILSAHELSEMAKGNPNDTTVALNWMHRSIRDNKVSPEARASFERLLPQMLRDEPIGSVAWCLSQLYEPGSREPHVLLDIASRLERAMEPRLALKFYEMAYGDSRATPADHEACLFRVGLLCDNSLNDPARAYASYKAVVDRFPMSPFADQARIRLSSLMQRHGAKQ